MVVSDQLPSGGKSYTEAHRSKEVQLKSLILLSSETFRGVRNVIESANINNSQVLILGLKNS